MSHIEAIYSDYSSCCTDFIVGIEHLKQRSISHAIHYFNQAYRGALIDDSFRNRYESYYGLARVLNGDAQGLDMCVKAALNECYDGDIFLNLVRAEYIKQNREKAVTALLKGLEVDSSHPGLQLMAQQLGLRRRNALPFLHRGHPLNRCIGRFLRRRKVSS